MIPLAEARARVMSTVRVLGPERVPIGRARGLVLAEEIRATEAIPPFANTAMDGFAVRSADTVGASDSSPRALRITGTVAAGAVSDHPVEPGTAQRIMTGAPMPAGADAVIMVELTRADGDTVEALAEVPSGNHVRPAGDDLRPGDRLFAPGETLSPGHLGVLASLGRTDVEVIRRPRVGVFSTGDELTVGPAPLEPGQIRDSNRPTLLALCEEAEFEAVDLGKLRDDEDEIEAALDAAVASCDALLTSGGVSMGDFDFVKRVLLRRGDLNWMQVAIRPAKPLAVGLVGDTPVFGLPGNPVSSMVSFELFARPALRTMMGRSDVDRPRVRAISEDDFPRKADGKTYFLRVRAWPEPDGSWRVRSAGGQGSHQLRAMADGNALAICPDGDGVRAGDHVEVLLLR